MHVGASFDSPDEAWKAREKPPEEELETGFWKPYIGRRDDESASGRQVATSGSEKEVWISEVFNSLATHNGFV